MKRLSILCYIVLALVLSAHAVEMMAFAATTKPTIKTQPKDVITSVGKTVTLSVKATGGKLKYQWYYSKNAGKTWIAIKKASAKTANYKLKVAKRHNGYQYYCRVRNSKGSVKSQVVTLTFDTPPTITAQPKSVTVNVGSPVTFSVKATGKNLSYEWYCSTDEGMTWKKTADGRSASYTLEASRGCTGNLYRCQVYSGKAFSTSASARLNMMGVSVKEFSRGLLTLTSGGEKTSDFTARSDYYPFHKVEVTWKSPDYAYRLYFYDKNYNLCGYTDLQKISGTYVCTDYSGALYFRLSFESLDGSSLDWTPTIPKGCGVVTDRKKLTLYHEKPKSKGVLNFLKRVEQGMNLTYTTLDVLPQHRGDIAAGTEVHGLVYSSSREEMLCVPNCVSWDSFMTALKNPNSYVYTRTSKLTNSKTYYGNVCSGFLSYAYNLNRVSNSAEMVRLSEFTKRAKQDVDHLELGDLLKKTSHVICVYDILRDASGKIVLVRFAQETNPLAYIMGDTPQGTNTMLDTIYKAYKFNKFDSITYTESQWVSARDEGKKNPKWNTVLIPRRGDKANWPLGETVEIDIMKKGSYTKALLYKDSTLIKETSISNIKCLSYEGLGHGTYKVCLSNGTDRSGFCYFKVVTSQVKVKNLGNGKAKIWFSSEDGTPSWYSWDTVNGASIKFPEKTGNITSKMKSNGYLTTAYKGGPWYFRVYFKNEYGTFCSSFVKAEITK